VRTDNHRATCRPWRQADGNKIANASRLGIVAVPLLEEAPWCQWRHEECKPHAALVGFSKRSSRAELERATGTEIKAAISFHFLAANSAECSAAGMDYSYQPAPPEGFPVSVALTGSGGAVPDLTVATAYSTACACRALGSACMRHLEMGST
jgi:hypothetical protein